MISSLTMLAVVAATLGRLVDCAPRKIMVLPHEDNCRYLNVTTLRYVTDTLLVDDQFSLKSYLSEMNLTLMLRNATETSCRTGGLSFLIQAMQDPEVVGVVGGLNEEVCAAGETLAQMHSKPLVLWNCHGWQSATDKVAASSRVAPNVGLATFALASSLNDLRVKYAVLVVCERQPWTALATELEIRLRPSGVVVHRVIPLSPDATPAEVDAALRVIKTPVKAILLSMDLWGSLLTHTLVALHRQGLADGSFAFFLVATPEALRPDTVPKLPGKAQDVLRALFVITFVTAETSYARLWRDSRVQQIHHQVASLTSSREAYNAFRYFNALSLLITALWRRSATSPRVPDGSKAAEDGVFPLNGSFQSLPWNPSRSDARGNVLMKAVLLDYNPGGDVFAPVREMEFRDSAGLPASDAGTYEVSDRNSAAWTTTADWPGGQVLEPDPECVLKEIGCGGAWSSE